MKLRYVTLLILCGTNPVGAAGLFGETRLSATGALTFDLNEGVSQIHLTPTDEPSNDGYAEAGATIDLAIPGQHVQLHYSGTHGFDHSVQGLGLRIGNLALAARLGSGQASQNQHYQALDLGSNFFHGEPYRDYEYRGIAASLDTIQGLTLGGSVTELSSPGANPRTGRTLTISSGRYQAAAYHFQSNGRNAGYGVDIGITGEVAGFGWQTLRSREGSRIDRLTASYRLSDTDTLGISIEQGINPMFAAAEERRAMLTFERSLDSRKHQPVELNLHRYQQAADVVDRTALTTSRMTSGRFQGIARFLTQTGAAHAALVKINPRSVRENREYGGTVFRNGDRTFSHSGFVAGTTTSVTFVPEAISPIGTTITAAFHTHAGFNPEFNSENFSATDIQTANDFKVDAYLATPLGRFLWYQRLNKLILFSQPGFIPNGMPRGGIVQTAGNNESQR